ncbi:MAG: hypothetical protein DI537_14035 [Stutzerimonas stutzeri]|nr:MAG: hypothetical protein DI537_14035 [Stutzerimonas stutzeri]
MPTPPSVFTSFRPSTDEVEPIREGDCLLILRKDGSVQVINPAYNRVRLTLPEEEQTEADRQIIRQGEKLFALALAATNDKLMDFLLSVAQDPTVVDYDALIKMTRLN